MKEAAENRQDWRRYLRPPPPPPRDVRIFTSMMVVLGVLALVMVWSALVWRDARQAEFAAKAAAVVATPRP